MKQQATKTETGATSAANFIQAKLTVGAVNDPMEKEADEMADHVMRMPDLSQSAPTIQRKCAKCEAEEKAQRKEISPFIQRKVAHGDESDEEEKKIQLKAMPPFIQRKETTGAFTAPNSVHGQINATKGSGSKMDSRTRSFMEQGFGTDFSNVNIHTDESAANMNRDLSAYAFTVGNDIYFNKNQYNPSSSDGKRLLAHELTHVMQQSTRESTTNHSGNKATADQMVHSVPVSIARKTLFEEFSDGKYNWNFLKLALEHDRPFKTIIDDINVLSSADRDLAIKDITQMRIERDRQRNDLIARYRAQSNPDDPDVVSLFKPILSENKRVLDKIDFVLNGLFLTVAGNETKTSLIANTTLPSAAQKPLIASALKPDIRVKDDGTVETFKECLMGPCTPGDSGSYLAKLRKYIPDKINNLWNELVKDKGKSEHDDPNKVHLPSELERIGIASANETDAVFGKYKKGKPLKADTKTSRGNIHDLWQDKENMLKTMSANQKLEMARVLMFYFFQSDKFIRYLNSVHSADPRLTKGGVGINEEGKDQAKIVEESTNTPQAVKKLNEIDRGWEGEEAGGQIYMQIFKKPDQADGDLAGQTVADRDFLWDTFQILIHEYLHALVSDKYYNFATSFEGKTNSLQYNTLIEGVDTLLDEVVWNAVAPRVTEPSLRAAVEGPTYSKLPPIAVKPASRRRYASYTEAVKLVNIVGIRNLYAAYFLGDVDKIKP
ncbi:MAG: DUF4157 domain-containing protein [Chitinophagaceae bacterium]|jgi:hypothetical protein|nr:DUF4157 domain-containing protein [Chitinophagaceae bacterium]